MKYIWILVYCTVLLWSGIHPKDQFTWFLEVVPAIFGGVLLAVTYNSFKLSTLLYILILIHCIILMVGGHYTYFRGSIVRRDEIDIRIGSKQL
jgi:putative membrane protein